MKQPLTTHDIIIVANTARRGVGSASYLAFALPDGIKGAITTWVESQLNDEAGPAWIMRQGLQQYIRDSYHQEMSLKRIGNLAARWGLEWGPIKKTPNGYCSPERKLLRQVFTLQVATAVLRVDAIVYTDESFSNENSQNNMSFHLKGHAARSVRTHWRRRTSLLGART